MAASVELDGMIFNNENAMGDERHESSQKQPVHERNLDATLQEDDLALDKNLRPQHLSEYLGREKIKSRWQFWLRRLKSVEKHLITFCFRGLPA